MSAIKIARCANLINLYLPTSLSRIISNNYAPDTPPMKLQYPIPTLGSAILFFLYVPYSAPIATSILNSTFRSTRAGISLIKYQSTMASAQLDNSRFDRGITVEASSGRLLWLLLHQTLYLAQSWQDISAPVIIYNATTVFSGGTAQLYAHTK